MTSLRQMTVDKFIGMVEAPPTKALTKREAQVIALIGEGKSAKEVGEILFISKRTVDFHLANIFEKLECKNRIEALVKLAKAEKLLEGKQP